MQWHNIFYRRTMPVLLEWVVIPWITESFFFLMFSMSDDTFLTWIYLFVRRYVLGNIHKRRVRFWWNFDTHFPPVRVFRIPCKMWIYFCFTPPLEGARPSWMSSYCLWYHKWLMVVIWNNNVRNWIVFIAINSSHQCAASFIRFDNYQRTFQWFALVFVMLKRISKQLVFRLFT